MKDFNTTFSIKMQELRDSQAETDRQIKQIKESQAETARQIIGGTVVISDENLKVF